MAGKDVSSVEGLTLTVKNYKDYLNSTNSKLKAEAQKIRDYLRDGYITEDGKTTSKWDSTVGVARARAGQTSAGTSAVAAGLVEKKKQEEEAAAAKLNSQRVANGKALKAGLPLPYPDVASADQKAAADKAKKEKSDAVATQEAKRRADLAAQQKAALASGTTLKASTAKVTSGAATAGVASTTAAVDGQPRTATTATGGTVSDTKIDKTAWISFMRQTFKTMTDTNESAIIMGLLETAKDKNWDEDYFMSMLDQKSTWWREQLPSMQQFFLESTDPRKVGVFQEKVNNTTAYVQSLMDKLGVNLNRVDPITGKVMSTADYTEAVHGLVLQKMKNGWDDNQFEDYLAGNVDVVFSGGGTIGTAISNIKNWADSYGVNISNDYAKQINASILDPNDGRDTQWWYNEMQRQSIEAYAPFADGLQMGRTMKDMTTSYRNTMASVLEVDPESISWNDLMKYAVTKDEKTGASSKTSMADFTKLLRNDPAWQKTQNARETYSSMAVDLLRDFGIMG